MRAIVFLLAAAAPLLTLARDAEQTPSIESLAALLANKPAEAFSTPTALTTHRRAAASSRRVVPQMYIEPEEFRSALATVSDLLAANAEDWGGGIGPAVGLTFLALLIASLSSLPDPE